MDTGTQGYDQQPGERGEDEKGVFSRGFMVNLLLTALQSPCSETDSVQKSLPEGKPEPWVYHREAVALGLIGVISSLLGRKATALIKEKLSVLGIMGQN